MASSHNGVDGRHAAWLGGVGGVGPHWHHWVAEVVAEVAHVPDTVLANMEMMLKQYFVCCVVGVKLTSRPRNRLQSLSLLHSAHTL